MDEKVIKNYLFNLSYQLFLIILPLITTPYVSRRLGVDNIGIYSFTSSNVSYFLLVIAFGFHVFGQREIAKHQNDISKRSQLFFEIQSRKGVLALVTILLYLIFIVFQNKYRVVYLLQIMSLIAVFFDISYFFQGLELYKITVIRNGIIKLIGVVCVFVFVQSESDLITYILIYCITNLLGNISLWLYVRKYLSVQAFHSFSFFKDMRIILELFIPVISVQLYFHVDKTMLGLICSEPTENGYYEQAIKIIRICQTIITSLGGVLITSVSRMIGEKDDQRIVSTIHDSICVGLLFAIAMIFGICSIADVFVPCFFGAGYDKVSTVMMSLSPMLAFSAISGVITNGVLIPTNKHNYVSVATLSAAITNIIMNAILIPILFSVGAAIASVIAELIVLFVSINYAKPHVKKDEIMGSILRYVFAGIMMFSVLYIFKSIMIKYLSDIALTIVLIAIGVIVYICFLVMEKDRIVCSGIEEIKRRFLK